LFGVLRLPAFSAPAVPAPKPGEPTDPKARKTFANAEGWQKRGDSAIAADTYRKANKQDGGHCSECLHRANRLASMVGDYKASEAIGREELAGAQTDDEKAIAHFNIAVALQQQGLRDKKDRYFSESCEEYKSALALNPGDTIAHFGMGTSLAHLHQDDAARAEFSEFLAKDKQLLLLHQRAARYVDRIELARARMAPAFTITTLDGQSISMDSLTGKVVLIDFWATWCGPCRQALPRIRKIAQQFQGQPLVVISISLDKDEAKWRDFVGKNGMTWPQYRDGSFDGSLSKLFSVNAIPATFTIDTDGVLEDQHVGDASIEGKLKKLVAHAGELGEHKTQVAAK